MRTVSYFIAIDWEKAQTRTARGERTNRWRTRLKDCYIQVFISQHVAVRSTEHPSAFQDDRPPDRALLACERSVGDRALGSRNCSRTKIRHENRFAGRHLKISVGSIQNGLNARRAQLFEF